MQIKNVKKHACLESDQDAFGEIYKYILKIVKLYIINKRERNICDFTKVILKEINKKDQIKL